MVAIINIRCKSFLADVNDKIYVCNIQTVIGTEWK